MGTSSMPSWSFLGSDKFDLYRVPGISCHAVELVQI